MFIVPVGKIVLLFVLDVILLCVVLFNPFAFGQFSAFVLCTVLLLQCFSSLKRDDELRWEWEKIDVNAKDIASKIYLRSPGFEFGTATASHQVEGGNTNNNWHAFEQLPNKIKNGDKSGKACDHFNLFPQDIKLMKDELKVHSYRFSIEWSRLQPKRGTWNTDAIKHYHNVIDELIKQNITPILTIHHFSNPIWFEEMGAFEKEENLTLFIEFGEAVFKEYSNNVKIWCTINEPNVYAYAGYLDGIFPPGKKEPRNLAFTVLKNMLHCHTTLYHKLKSMQNGPQCKIGIVHNLHQFDPYNWWNPIDIVLAYVMDYTYNELMLTYFKTGQFYINIPGVGNESYFNSRAVGGNDFYGVNYYSHFCVKLNLQELTTKPFQLLVRPEHQRWTTDFKYPVYGEGLYRILHRVMKVPIWITENGCPDSKDEYLRENYIKRYLYSMSRAMEEGVNVHGYMYWSFCDNFEWAEGFSQRFGLYEMDYKTQTRKLRNGSKFFVDVVKELKILQGH
jgi:beta-glucosidase